MGCTHKMLAKKDIITGVVTFVGAVSKFTPEQIRLLQNTDRRYTYLKLPCGRCIGCRLNKSREWAVRLMHEAQTSSTACFITLTYDEDKLFKYFSKNYTDDLAYLKTRQMLWSLDTTFFQKFMKRFRKKVSPVKIRFFHCGEYGSSKGTMRPHHHAIIFNYDFPDKVLHSYKKLKGNIYNYYISEELSELWPFGFHIITECTEDSCGYCARYVTKKVNGAMSEEHYNGRKKEYITMSRNHGIGYDWFKSFGKTDCYPQDFVLTKNKFKIKPSRYYDKLFDLESPEEFEKIKIQREEFSKMSINDLHGQRTIDDTAKRQPVLDYTNEKRLEKLIRCYEDVNQHDDKFVEFQNKCSAFGIPKDFVDLTIEKSKYLSQYDETPFESANKIAMKYLTDMYGQLSYEDLFKVKKSKKKVNPVKEVLRKVKEM